MTTFAAVAILGTGARLYHRHVLRKLWWDDLWAVGSLVAQFTLLVGLWIRTDTPGMPQPMLELVRDWADDDLQM